jgi:hypothetical protein
VVEEEDAEEGPGRCLGGRVGATFLEDEEETEAEVEEEEEADEEVEEEGAEDLVGLDKVPSVSKN